MSAAVAAKGVLTLAPACCVVPDVLQATPLSELYEQYWGQERYGIKMQRFIRDPAKEYFKLYRGFKDGNEQRIACKSKGNENSDELMSLAKENGMELTEEEAKAYF